MNSQIPKLAIKPNGVLSWITPKRFAYLGIGLFLIGHLYRIDAPPSGSHAWRESDTAAVALNYYQEDFTFTEPRINQRGAKSGITGMELPIYCWSAAALYFVFGPTHIVPHSLTLIAALGALFLLFSISRRLFDERVAAFAVWALAFSPLFFYYSYKIMPDIWMIALWLASIALFLRFLESESYSVLLLSALALAISAMIKPLGLCIYLVYLIALAPRVKVNKKLAPLFVGYVLLTFLPAYLWFQFANDMIQMYGASFHLGDRFGNTAEYLFSWRFFKRIFWQGPSEMWIGWSLVAPFIIGFFALRSERMRWWPYGWLAGVILVFAATAQMSSTHNYYNLIATAPCALITGVGLRCLSLRNGWRRWLMLLLIVAAPVAGASRIAGKFGATSDFYSIRADSENLLAAKQLVIVEDVSQPIRLYQLNRRGWYLRGENYFKQIANAQTAGARTLLLESPLSSYTGAAQIKTLVDSTGFRVGSLFGYSLKRVSPSGEETDAPSVPRASAK